MPIIQLLVWNTAFSYKVSAFGDLYFYHKRPNQVGHTLLIPHLAGLLGFESDNIWYVKGGLVSDEKFEKIIGDDNGCFDDYNY